MQDPGLKHRQHGTIYLHDGVRMIWIGKGSKHRWRQVCTHSDCMRRAVIGALCTAHHNGVHGRVDGRRLPGLPPVTSRVMGKVYTKEDGTPCVWNGQSFLPKCITCDRASPHFRDRCCHCFPKSGYIYAMQTQREDLWKFGGSADVDARRLQYIGANRPRMWFQKHVGDDFREPERRLLSAIGAHPAFNLCEGREWFTTTLPPGEATAIVSSFFKT